MSELPPQPETLNPDPPATELADMPDGVPSHHADLPGDWGPEFGQRWFLEDPAGLQPF